MAVVAIAGMPGSCKSKLIEQYVSQEFHKFDDFNTNWGGHLAEAKKHIARGENIVVSDIEFRNEDFRQRFNSDIGVQVE